MSKYADTLKAAKDLLTKNYTASKKVEVKTGADGIAYTAEAVVGKPAALSLKTEAAFGDLKVDQLKVGSDDKIVLELSNSSAIKGAKLTFKATDGSRAAGAAGISASVGAEAKLGATNFSTLDINVLETATLPFSATTLFNYEGFLLGGAVDGSLLKPALKDANAILGYKTKSSTFAFQTSKNFAVGTVGVFQQATPELAFASTAAFPLKGAGKIDVAAGLSYKVSADTTAFLKASSAGKVGASYVQVLSPKATLTLSTELDAANLASDDHKFGLTLALKA